MRIELIPEFFKVVRHSHWVYDDFYHYVDTEEWTKTASDLGDVTIADGVGGLINLSPSDATVADNDETYLESKLETFKFAASKPIYFECFLQFTEANVDDANIFAGLVDAVAADLLVDNGGGMKTTASGVGFYKIDGETTWRVWNSVSTTQKSTTLSAANSLTKAAVTAGGAYQRLSFEVVFKTGSLFDVMFWVGDDLVAKHLDQALGTPTEMQVGFGAKNGSANEESLNVDYVLALQTR